MKKEYLKDTCCPVCRVDVDVRIYKEQFESVLEGDIICKKCNRKYPISDGIPMLYIGSNAQKGVFDLFNETPYGLIGARDAFTSRYLSKNIISETPWYIDESNIENLKILEAGCGGGHLYAEFHLLGANVIGMDQTPNSLKCINQLFLENNKMANLVNGNIEQIPFKDNTFDVVTSMGVIHHTPNTLNALTNLVKVTKPNGNIHLMVYHKISVWNYVKRSLRYLCNSSKIFSALILKLTPLWMGETLSQSNTETVFRDNMVNPITKSFSADDIEKMINHIGNLRIEKIDRHEIVELYVLGKKIYKSKLLRWYEKRFGWFLYLKLKKIG